MITTIVFSRDRACQLDACLRSLAMHCSDLDALDVHVIWRADDPRHAAAYEGLAKTCGFVDDDMRRIRVTFTREHNFEGQVRDLLRNASHVLFLVDDTMFVAEWSARECVIALDIDPKVIGISLRLGQNTTRCYTLDHDQAVPNMRAFGVEHDSALMSDFDWTTADGDFAYPFEVSSSMYHSGRIRYALDGQSFRNPNELEATLADAAKGMTKAAPLLACYGTSRAFSIPANRVQSTYANRSGTRPEWSADALLARWERGERIRIEAYAGHVPSGCHEEVELEVERVRKGEVVEVVAFDPGDELPRIESVRAPVHITVTSTAVNAGESAFHCTRSVIEQTFKEWRHAYVDAASDDRTKGFATRGAGCGTVDSRFHITRTPTRLSLLENLLPVWRSLPDDEVIVWLDGDDRLATDEALEVVARAHESGALATYGSFIWQDGTLGFAAHVGPDPRREDWHATHLKTFRAGLVKRIRDEDLRWPDGAYLDLAIDQAIMLPVVEMAAERARFIPQVLYVYNSRHSFYENANESERARELEAVRLIRSRARYGRVS